MRRKLYIGFLIGIFFFMAQGQALSYTDQVLSNNPVAYWKLGDLSGSSASTELAGSENASYSGTFSLGQEGAVSGDSAASFNGGSFATSGTLGRSLFANRNVITVEFWIKPNASQTGRHIMEYGTGVSTFALEGTLLTPNFFINNILVGNLALNLGEYQQIVLQMTGAEAKIFHNGLEISSTAFTQSIQDKGNNGMFFASRGGNQRFANINVDEIAVYHTALSSGQIAQNFNVGVGAVPEPQSLLLLLGAACFFSLKKGR